MNQAKIVAMLAVSLGLALVSTIKPAGASPFVITPSVAGPVTGAVYDNLNPGSAGPAVTFTGNAGYVTGASPYNYAPPVLSNGNGAMFGNSNGVDTSQYIAVEGAASAQFHFNSLQQYLGLLWGSVDSFNTLSFYNNATLIGSVTGTSVTAGATGDQGANGTYYVNINSSLPFNTVIASSSGNSFEFDNIAYATPVPEPASLTVFGTGLLLLAFTVRFRRKHSI
jgi:hypothetical protein